MEFRPLGGTEPGGEGITAIVVLRGPPGRIVLDMTLPTDDPEFVFPRDRTGAGFQAMRRRLIDALEPVSVAVA